jgi:GNAT superfamily N-acetyltransferase
MPQIKKAGINDIELIRQLAHGVWPDTYGAILTPQQLAYMLDLIYSTAALTKQVEQLHHQFIILYDNKEAVGFASYSPKQSNDHSIYRIHKLYITPNQQGKGNGKLLLNFIIDEIKPLGANTLELNVNRHNKALHFYNKIGFTISRKEDIDIGNEYYMNDYVMELRLRTTNHGL